jgi:hypothetical protein
MTVEIIRPSAADAYDLIYPDHLATLSMIEQETMRRSIMNSAQLWLGKDDAAILAMWGLISPTLMSDRAYLWLYTTKHLPGHTFGLVRRSQRIVRGMLDDYSTIVGHCKLDALRSQQWLRWLGAEFGPPIDNITIPFTIKAQQWQQDSAQLA